MSITNHNRIKLGIWYKRICYAIWLILAVTGIYWTWRQDFALHDPDELSVTILKVHGIGAALSLIVFGLLINSHIALAIQRKRNQVSGFIVLALLTITSASGYGLYYSPATWHDIIKWVHVWLGVVLVAFLPVHIVLGRWLQKRQIARHRIKQY